MIKAVIFDLDNTLYDYDFCNTLAERALLNCIARDFCIPEEKVSELLKNAKSNVKKQLGNSVASAHNRILYMQNICEQAGKNPLLYAVKFYDTYWNALLKNMKLFDYVEPTMEKLHDKKIKVGILTDLTALIQYRKIDELGISELVNYLVTSEEAGKEKPSEKMFHLMLQKMCVNPNEALMIGDSKKKDIEGAERVGMKAILFNRNLDMKKMILKEIESI